MRLNAAIPVFICAALISACTATAQAVSTSSAPPPTATQTSTQAPLPLTSTAAPPTLSPTATPTAPPPLPSATLTPIPTETVVYPAWRSTPPTLMLHRSTESFDSVAFLREFVQILKAGGYHVVTYEQINADPSITAREQGRLFIITIDDVPLCTNMDPSLPEMFAILEEAGYPAVLGVITQGERALDSAIDTLTRLHGLGWELAAHGDTHRNLLTIQQESPGEVFWEIKACLDKMESFLGVRPHTLILPEGQMIEDPHYIANNEIQWVVGITGGEMYDSTDGLSYVGRMGPNLTAEHTFELLVKRFSP